MHLMMTESAIVCLLFDHNIPVNVLDMTNFARFLNFQLRCKSVTS